MIRRAFLKAISAVPFVGLVPRPVELKQPCNGDDGDSLMGMHRNNVFTGTQSFHYWSDKNVHLFNNTVVNTRH